MLYELSYFGSRDNLTRLPSAPAITKRRPASLNKRLSNLFKDLTVRHSLSLSVISHRSAQVWRKGFLAVFSALKCFATPLTAQQALVVHHLPF
jgi:hypothetical protein